MFMYLSSCWVQSKGNALIKSWYCSKMPHSFFIFTEWQPISCIMQMEPARHLLMHQTIQSAWIQPTFNFHQSFSLCIQAFFPRGICIAWSRFICKQWYGFDDGPNYPSSCAIAVYKWKRWAWLPREVLTARPPTFRWRVFNYFEMWLCLSYFSVLKYSQAVDRPMIWSTH